jgi:hypothetical protein
MARPDSKRTIHAKARAIDLRKARTRKAVFGTSK